jgi:hypothetical protein
VADEDRFSFDLLPQGFCRIQNAFFSECEAFFLSVMDQRKLRLIF